MGRKRSAIRRTRGGRRAYAKGAKLTRLKKSWKKRSMGSKKLRSQVRTTGNLYSVSGIRRRLDNRPEMKYATIAFNAIAHLIPTTTEEFWNPNLNFLGGGTASLPIPTVGSASQAGYVGTQFNSLFALVRFSVEVAVNIASNDYLRVSVCQTKIAPNQLIAGGTFPAIPANFMQYWNTKEWKVMFDRTYGYLTAAAQKTGPKVFEFRIPLRQTMTQSPTVVRPLFDRPVQIFLSTGLGTQIQVSNLAVKYFWRDP